MTGAFQRTAFQPTAFAVPALLTGYGFQTGAFQEDAFYVAPSRGKGRPKGRPRPVLFIEDDDALAALVAVVGFDPF